MISWVRSVLGIGLGVDRYDVIIHIGAPKTGSSAIQKFCLNNRKALKKCGYYYPSHGIDKNGISSGHFIIGHLLRKRKTFIAKLLFGAMLLKARLRNRTLLLSSEFFYANAEGFSTLLRGLDVRVIGWFRHPVERLMSSYNQSVKRNFNVDTIEEFLKEKSSEQWPNPKGVPFHRWADLVGDDRCHFVFYGQGLGNRSSGSIEKQWVELLNLDSRVGLDFCFDHKRVNRSYAPEALELKRLLNLVLKEQGSGVARAVDRALQAYSDHHCVHDHGFPSHFCPAEVKQLCAVFSASNSSLVSRFPSLGPLLEQDRYYLEEARETKSKSLDLKPPLVYLARSCPGEMIQIRQKLDGLVDRTAGVDSNLNDLRILLDAHGYAA